MVKKINKSDEEWKEVLSPESFEVTRLGGTERPFSGQYWDHKENGRYKCICCGEFLFSSDSKFDSGSGWPSFSNPISDDYISKIIDKSFGMTRIEVKCKKCDSHLGHVFNDGPKPSGLRYCINSASLLLVLNE